MSDELQAAMARFLETDEGRIYAQAFADRVLAVATPIIEAPLRETIEDLVRQFGHHTVKDGVPCLWTGGLSALEGAFAVLGWDDPHPSPEDACQYPGCPEWATCGSITADGYWRTCGAHFGYQHATTTGIADE